eukprot:7244440-Prymnesium_polylepis.1
MKLPGSPSESNISSPGCAGPAERPTHRPRQSPILAPPPAVPGDLSPAKLARSPTVTRGGSREGRTCKGRQPDTYSEHCAHDVTCFCVAYRLALCNEAVAVRQQCVNSASTP